MKQIDGQLSLFDFIKPECSYSGHTCNKENLWEVADSFDDFTCPHTCCRNCKNRFCGARCNGSEEPRPVKIMGLMDDAYCPNCSYCFWETKELDCERCPRCGIRVDWTPWHKVNDTEETCTETKM